MATAKSAKHAAPRSRWRIVLLVAALVIATAASSVAGLGYIAATNIERRPVEGITTPGNVREVTFDDDEGPLTSQILNVLIIGSDDRENLGEAQSGNFGEFEGRRSDSLFLAQFVVGGQGAALLSFPRDLRVELCNGQTDKINAAMYVGEMTATGAETCLVETVSGHTGIEIDHYVEVDFSGFIDVVDAIGGVNMYLEEPMQDTNAHIDLAAGCQTLDGEQALGFVRSRGYDSDLGRIQRQQRFVRETLNQVTDFGTLSNPRRLVDLVEAGADSVITDENLDLNRMTEMAGGFRQLAGDGLLSFTVPAHDEMIDGVAFLIENEAEAEQIYASFRDSSVLRQAEAEVAPDGEEPLTAEEDGGDQDQDPDQDQDRELTDAEGEPGQDAGDPDDGAPDEQDKEEAEPQDPGGETEIPQDVQVPPVVVLNTTSTGGLAGAVADHLQAVELQVGSLQDAQDQPLEHTEVVHGPGYGEQARAVAIALGGAEVREDPGVTDVMAFIGEDLNHEVIAAGIQPREPGTTVAAVHEPEEGQDEAAPEEPTEEPEPDPTPIPTEEPTARNASIPQDVEC